MPVTGYEVRCHSPEVFAVLSPEPYLGWVRRWNIITLIFVGGTGHTQLIKSHTADRQQSQNLGLSLFDSKHVFVPQAHTQGESRV